MPSILISTTCSMKKELTSSGSLLGFMLHVESYFCFLLIDSNFLFLLQEFLSGVKEGEGRREPGDVFPSLGPQEPSEGWGVHDFAMRVEQPRWRKRSGRLSLAFFRLGGHTEEVFITLLIVEALTVPLDFI